MTSGTADDTHPTSDAREHRAIVHGVARYELRRPAHTFVDVHWTDVHGPETFSFLTCVLTRAAGAEPYRGWVYYPHPETKPMHEQPSTVLEVLMPYLPGLVYGDTVTLHLDPAEIAVSGSA